MKQTLFISNASNYLVSVSVNLTQQAHCSWYFSIL